MSLNKTYKSNKKAPTAPQELTVVRVHDTSVRLRWIEPRAPNGILQGYTLHVHDIAADINETRRVNDVQRVLDHSLGNLKPFTLYKISVSAFTHKFQGELSNSLKIKTDVSAPSAPLLVNLSCVWPENAIRLQWQRPDKFYSQIDFYYVHYKSDSAWHFDETQLAAKREKLLNELLISNLTADELYELRVLAGTRSLVDSTHVYKSEPSLTTRVVLQPNCEGKFLNFEL